MCQVVSFLPPLDNHNIVNRQDYLPFSVIILTDNVFQLDVHRDINVDL